MANEDLHTIRFKSGGVEFELSSSATEVAKAVEMLSPAIAAAFAEAPADDGGHTDGSNGGGQSGSPRARKRRTRASSSSSSAGGGSDERAGIREKLHTSSVEGFPKIGANPGALLAGLALLSWAHKKLGIDGLTAPEIQYFFDDKWRLKRTPQAYRQALDRRVREGEIDAKGDPRVFRIMGAGETKLEELLKKSDEKTP